ARATSTRKPSSPSSWPRAEQEGAETREWTYLRKDGSPLSVTLSVTVLRDEAGAINGYLGIAVDVTEWRNA
ncbi:PAS domain-containing protein, partial [Pseudomonas aeruginosa]